MDEEIVLSGTLNKTFPAFDGPISSAGKNDKYE
jgi:hypothetical protein